MLQKDVIRSIRRWVINDYLTLCRCSQIKPSLREVIRFTKEQTPHAVKYVEKHKSLVNFQFQ